MTQEQTLGRLKMDQGSFQRTNGYIDIIVDRVGVTRASPVLRIPIYKHDGTATKIANCVVQAVNNHDALLEAAEAAVVWMDGADHAFNEDERKVYDGLQAAIEQAEGRTA